MANSIAGGRRESSLAQSPYVAGRNAAILAEQEAAKRSRPENFTAYELYLAGHSEHLRLNQDGNKNAIELLEKAVAADPRLARAWAELSTARQASTNYGADPTLANSAALAAARSAVEIDPRDAMAHAQLAFALAMKGDFAPSGAEFDTALRLNPGDAEVLAMYAAWPSSFGHPEHGAEAADHAIRLNPNYQVWQAWNFSWAYFASVDSKTLCASWNGSRKTTTSSTLGCSAPRAMRLSAGPRKRRRPRRMRFNTSQT